MCTRFPSFKVINVLSDVIISAIYKTKYTCISLHRFSGYHITFQDHPSISYMRSGYLLLFSNLQKTQILFKSHYPCES